MFAVRFHGRGGQGVVTAAELLASAAFREDRHAQAFPSFGSERMGAPVMSFCRIDDKPIRTREPVTEPDALLIQDPTLLHQADVFAGLAPDGYVLINATRGFGELGLDDFAASRDDARLLTVPASTRGHPWPGGSRRLPPTVRAAPGTRPRGPGVDRRHGRPRGIHRGAVPGGRADEAGP